jgi:hypothetical protein
MRGLLGNYFRNLRDGPSDPQILRNNPDSKQLELAIQRLRHSRAMKMVRVTEFLARRRQRPGHSIVYRRRHLHAHILCFDFRL